MLQTCPCVDVVADLLIETCCSIDLEEACLGNADVCCRKLRFVG